MIGSMNPLVVTPRIAIELGTIAIVSRRPEPSSATTAKLGVSAQEASALLVAKGAHLGGRRRSGAPTGATAALLPPLQDLPMCLLDARFAVTCKRTWLSLA